MYIIISKAQARALRKLYERNLEHPEKPAMTPAELKESLPTLNALVDEGYAARQLTLGFLTEPRTCSYYQITLEGVEDYPDIDYVG